MQFLRETKIDFMKNRKLALTISSVLILIGIASLILHGGPRQGIDFLGGVSLRLHFDTDIDVGKIRSALGGTAFEKAAIKKMHGIDDAGKPLPSGFYFCRLKVGRESKTVPIVLVR